MTEETAIVNKRMIDAGRVSVIKSVEEKNESIDVNLFTNEYTIEHTAINEIYKQHQK